MPWHCCQEINLSFSSLPPNLYLLQCWSSYWVISLPNSLGQKSKVNHWLFLPSYTPPPPNQCSNPVHSTSWSFLKFTATIPSLVQIRWDHPDLVYCNNLLSGLSVFSQCSVRVQALVLAIQSVIWSPGSWVRSREAQTLLQTSCTRTYILKTSQGDLYSLRYLSPKQNSCTSPQPHLCPFPHVLVQW